MRGYRILYLNEKGERDSTFFVEPMTSLVLSPEALLSYVEQIFILAHPNCSIIEISNCKLEDFKK